MAMLKALEQWREKYGANILSEQGVEITHLDLYKFFVNNDVELQQNYGLRGNVYCIGNTCFGIEDSSISHISWDFDNRIVITRKSLEGVYLSNVILKCSQYKDASIKLWYSTCDWIDIHIYPKDLSSGICLCFPPRHILKEEVK